MNKADHSVRGFSHNLPNEKSAEVNRLTKEWFSKYGVLLPAKGKETP